MLEDYSNNKNIYFVLEDNNTKDKIEINPMLSYLKQD